MAAQAPREKGLNLLHSAESPKLMVQQPRQLKELTKLLESFEALPQRISERAGEDISQDLGATGGATAGTQTSGVSPRDQAIAAMPTSPAVLKKELAEHIEREVGQLRRLARKAARASRPGDAFRLNQIYARIRRLNALLVELVGAAIDVLKRLYIRVFVDRQPIL